jgi:hypothetical protein
LLKGDEFSPLITNGTRIFHVPGPDASKTERLQCTNAEAKEFGRLIFV